MNYCPQCGVQLPEKAKFCSECGRNLSGDVSQDTNSPKMISDKDARDEERANKKQFYISKNSQRLGPFSKRDIQAKLDDGSVAPIDWIWRAPMTEWQPVYALIDSREVEDILKQAASINPENEKDTATWNERAGEFAVAIKKANGLCPWAHIQLGFCLSKMGFHDRAKQELKTALAQYQYSVGARYLMLFYAIDELDSLPLER